MTWAALLLAAALLTNAGPSRVRVRAGLKAELRQRSPETGGRGDPLAVASSLDVLAVCLTAGMPVSSAAAATAPAAPPQLARLLTRAADLLALGADPATAWSSPDGSLDHQCEALLRLARRSASSGAALAHGIADLAEQSRNQAADSAAAAAERAAVLIAAPLGLCYLPAFVCLGIVPVVAGLAGDVLRSGLV
jgi:pilus assembly protein TadC